MELRRGIEVRIPNQLSQSGMSYYFRYYDSIINIVKTNIHINDKKQESIQEFEKSISSSMVSEGPAKHINRKNDFKYQSANHIN